MNRKPTILFLSDNTIGMDGIYSLLEQRSNYQLIKLESDLANLIRYNSISDDDIVISKNNIKKLSIITDYEMINKILQSNIILLNEEVNEIDNDKSTLGTFTISLDNSFEELNLLLKKIENKIQLSNKEKTKNITKNKESEFSISKREQEIITLISKGYTAKKIATLLDLSDRTVGKHKENIFKKFNVHSAIELINKMNNFNN